MSWIIFQDFIFDANIGNKYLVNLNAIKPILVSEWHLIGNISNRHPIFVECWCFIANIPNAKPIFSQYLAHYCHYIGCIFQWNDNIDLILVLFVLFVLHWLNIFCQYWNNISRMSWPMTGCMPINAIWNQKCDMI